MYQRVQRKLVSVLLVTMLLFTGIFTGFPSNAVADSSSWVSVSNGLGANPVYALTVSPDNPDVVYAGTWGGVFRSVDRGATWTHILSDVSGSPYPYVSSLVIDPSNTQVIYVGTWDSGVHKTSDGGMTWAHVNNGLTNLDVRSLAIDPANPQVVYAGTYSGGAFKSVDGGATWAQISVGLDLVSIFAFAIDPTNTQVIYAGTQVYYGIENRSVFKSTDGGATWALMNNGVTEWGASSLAIDPTHTQTIYAGTSGYIFKSMDGGATWARMANGVYNTGVNAILIDPTNTQVVYAGLQGGSVAGVAKSDDGGDSWVQMNDGLTDPDVLSMAIDPTSSTLYAGTLGGGVFQRDVAIHPLPTITSSDLSGTVPINASRSFFTTIANPVGGIRYDNIAFQFRISSAALEDISELAVWAGDFQSVPLVADGADLTGTCSGAGWFLDPGTAPVDKWQITITRAGSYLITITLVDHANGDAPLASFTGTAEATQSYPRTVFSLDEAGGSLCRDEQDAYSGNLIGNVSFNTTTMFAGASSLLFGGTQGDYVETNMTFPNGDIYVQAWVNATTLTDERWYRPVVTNWTGSYGTVWLGFIGRHLNVQLNGGGVQGGMEVEVPAVAENTWMRIGFYYEPGARLTLYFNNAIVGQTTSNIPASLASNMSIRFGAYSYGYASTGFAGYIDEVVFRMQPVTPPPSFAPATFHLDENSGSVCRDEDSRFTGSLVGNVSFDGTTKHLGASSLLFGGTQGDYVETDMMFNNGDIFVEAWVYPTTITEERWYRPIVTNWTNEYGTLWFGFIGTHLNGQLNGGGVQGGMEVDVPGIAQDTWMKVALYYEHGARMTLYLNDTLVCETTSNIPASLASNMKVRFGAYGYGYASTGFVGNIDEIFITDQLPVLTHTVTPIIAGQPNTGTVAPAQQTGIPYGGTATFTVTPAPGCYVVSSVGTIVDNTWTIENVTQDLTPMITFNYLPTGNEVQAEVGLVAATSIMADSVENVPQSWNRFWLVGMGNWPDGGMAPIIHPTIWLATDAPIMHVSPSDAPYFIGNVASHNYTWDFYDISVPVPENLHISAWNDSPALVRQPGYRISRTVTPSVIPVGTTTQTVTVSFTLEEALPIGTDTLSLTIGNTENILQDHTITTRYVEGTSSCSSAVWSGGNSGDLVRVFWSPDLSQIVIGQTYTFSAQLSTTITGTAGYSYIVKPDVTVQQWHEVPLPMISGVEVPIDTVSPDGPARAIFTAEEPVDWYRSARTDRYIFSLGTVVMHMGSTQPTIVEGSLRLAPEKIQLKGNGLVQAFLSLPDPYTPESIIPESVRLCGLEPLKVHIAGGCLVATFTREQLRPVLPVLSEVKITCTGTLADNLSFKASCLASVSSGAPEQYNQEVVLAGNAATSLWPFEPGTPYDLSGALFRGLLGGRPNGELYADLATGIPDGKNGSIQLLGDGSTKVTVSLRSGLRWSDGHLITADDIRFTYGVASDPALWGPAVIPAVTVLNPSTVQLVWHNQLLPTVLEALSFPLLPEHAFDSSLPAADYPTAAFFRNPIVAGPYKVETWTDGTSVSLVPNPMFSGAAPTLQRITVLFLDAEATAAALRSGSVDMVLPDASPIDRMQYQALLPMIETNYRTMLTPTRSVGLLTINLDRPLLGSSDSTTLRKAMMMAIDGSAISGINLSLNRMLVGNVSGSLHAKSAIEYAPGVTPLSYNPTLARTVLRENSYTWRSDGQLISPTGSPVVVRIEYSAGATWRQQEAVYLQNSWWTALGISVIPMGVDFNGLIDRETSGDYEISLHGIGYSNFFFDDKRFDPRSIPTAPGWLGTNVYRLRGTDLEAAYDRLYTATSVSETVAACWSINGIVASRLPLIAIDTPVVPTIVKRQLQGVFFPLTSLGGGTSLRGALWNVENWRVGDPAPLAILNEVIPTGKVSQAFAAFLHASGGSGIDYLWRLASGTLPAGLSMNASGTIGGIPTTAGTYKVSVQVADINGTTSTRTITIVIQ
jgi:ABC-type transport system substrate-binding protein/photosystem II stability/assembly factor-like uncharacterized protein